MLARHVRKPPCATYVISKTWNHVSLFATANTTAEAKSSRCPCSGTRGPVPPAAPRPMTFVRGCICPGWVCGSESSTHPPTSPPAHGNQTPDLRRYSLSCQKLKPRIATATAKCCRSEIEMVPSPPTPLLAPNGPLVQCSKHPHITRPRTSLLMHDLPPLNQQNKGNKLWKTWTLSGPIKGVPVVPVPPMASVAPVAMTAVAAAAARMVGSAAGFRRRTWPTTSRRVVLGVVLCVGKGVGRAWWSRMRSVTIKTAARRGA